MESAALKCPLCLNVFKDPVTMGCGHNFCQDCLTHEFETKPHKYNDPPYYTIYPCPKCKKDFYTPDAFARNINLRNMAERIRGRTTNAIHGDHQTQPEDTDKDPGQNSLPVSDPNLQPDIKTKELPPEIQPTEEQLHVADLPVSAADLRKDLECFICQSVFKDPVTLRCGHNFCCDCISRDLEAHKVLEGDIFTVEYYFCPECKDRYSEKPRWVRNRTLWAMAQELASSSTNA